jgi:UDP-3-O-[3-hydroxymyristoyl] glucosamine N-acyltransferase
MIDSRFFDKLGPLDLAELADRTGARLSDPAMAGRTIDLVAPLARAGANAISFLVDPRRVAELKATGAGACFVPPALAEAAPEGCVALVADRPHLAWVQAANALHAIREDDYAANALIHPTARLEAGVVIAPGAVIGANVAIGSGTRIGACSVIGQGVAIGRECHIGPNVTIGFALIGDRVRIHAGARLGEPGFGATAGPTGPVEVPQLGRLIIQNGVSIGPNCCIDRGGWEDTVIGENTKLDNLVHIAHNVRIGRNCLIAGQVGIAGSSVIGDGVTFGGQAGVGDHLAVGDGASVGAQGGVLKDVPAGEVWSGTPARPLKQWLREQAAVSRLTKARATKGRGE